MKFFYAHIIIIFYIVSLFSDTLFGAYNKTEIDNLTKILSFNIVSKKISGQLISTPIRQLRVFDQTNHTLEGKMNSYCGYHALKNILLTFKFLENPTVNTKNQLTDKQVFLDYWESWKKILAKSNKPVIGEITAQIYWKTSDHDIMIGSYAPIILEHEEGGKYLQSVSAFGELREDEFKTIVKNKKLTLCSTEIIKTINNYINQLQAIKYGARGIAFSENPYHWIGIVLAKVTNMKGNPKRVYCFDSQNNRLQTTHPTVIFIAQCFNGNIDKDYTLEHYFSFILPQLITYLNSNDLLQNDAVLKDLITSAGKKMANQSPRLGIIAEALKDPISNIGEAFAKVLNQGTNTNDLLAVVNKFVEHCSQKLSESSFQDSLKVYYGDKTIPASNVSVESKLKQSTLQDFIDLKEFLNNLSTSTQASTSLIQTTSISADQISAVKSKSPSVSANTSSIQMTTSTGSSMQSSSVQASVQPQASAFESKVTDLKNSLEKLSDTFKSLIHSLKKVRKKLNPTALSAILVSTGLCGNLLACNQPSSIKTETIALNRLKSSFKNITFYDAQVLSQINLTIPHGSLYKQYYGCGFHAIKNALHLVRFLQDTAQYDRIYDSTALKRENEFFEYFEGWPHPQSTTPPNNSWYHIYVEDRKSRKVNYMPFYDPPTQDIDLENLKTAIIKHDARGPLSADIIMQHINIFEYIDGEYIDKTSPGDAAILIELAALYNRYDSIIIPIVLAYRHQYSTAQQKQFPALYDSTGRHWITVIINKWNNLSEVILADGWRNPNYLKKNWESVNLLLKWLTQPRNASIQYFNTLNTNKQPTLTDKELRLLQEAVNYIIKNPSLMVNEINGEKVFKSTFYPRFIEYLEWYKKNGHPLKIHEQTANMLSFLNKAYH